MAGRLNLMSIRPGVSRNARRETPPSLLVMDVLAGLLKDVRADRALFGQSIMRPPWSVRFADGAALTMLVMVQGKAWVRPDAVETTGHGGDAPAPDAVSLTVGDVAIVVGEAPFSIADSPDARLPARYTVRGADQPTGSDGQVLRADLKFGVRTCDEPDDGSAIVLTGSYHVDGPVSRRLLGALPRLVVVHDDVWAEDGRRAGELCPLLQVTFAEVVRDKPGQQAVLDRLLDLLLLTTLREWFDRPEAKAPSWYRALGDPIVGHALRLIHGAPEQPWTVAELAREVGVSRATLARRFTDLAGEPPMIYLRSWRLTLAADLLQRTDSTVDAVARKVGYVNGYSLSVAFKRALGTRPSDYRVKHPAA
jgi:AraC-like DNA-binding protein